MNRPNRVNLKAQVMIPLKIHRDNAADKALLAKARHRDLHLRPLRRHR